MPEDIAKLIEQAIGEAEKDYSDALMRDFRPAAARYRGLIATLRDASRLAQSQPIQHYLNRR